LAKSSPIDDFPVQGRYGQGVVAVRFSGKEARLAAAALGQSDASLMVVTNRSRTKPMRFDAAPRSGRNTTGSSVISLGAGESVQRVVTLQGRRSESVEDLTHDTIEAAQQPRLFDSDSVRDSSG
jgi:DNA gyrase subunit A